MKQCMVSLGMLALGASTAWAQNTEVIRHRQGIYKAFGQAAKPIRPMLKGEIPFDLAVVQAALKTIAEGAKQLPDLFPEDSKTGADTSALPEVWTRKDDFIRRFTKLGDDARAAMADIKDDASLKAEIPKVFGNCGSCHKLYRAKLQ